MIAQAVYFFMLTVTIPEVMKYSDGMKLLDMQPTGYSAEYAKHLLDTLSEQGRKVYLFKQIPFDMIYPGLFAVGYSLLLTFLFKKGFDLKSKIYYLSLVPVFAGLFDYLENIGVIVMISMYPKFSPAIASTTSVFSLIKSALAIAFFVLLVVGVIAWLIKKVRK